MPAREEQSLSNTWQPRPTSGRQIFPVLKVGDRGLLNRARWKLQRDQSIHRSGHEADGRHKRTRGIAGGRSWLFGRCRRWRWLHG